MGIVVVGGQARKVGKTTLVTAILKAMPNRRWVAVKITRCHHTDAGCHCELRGASFAMSEELQRDLRPDTCRYLVAGAARAFWMRTLPDSLNAAMPMLRDLLAASERAGSDVVIESNSVVRFLQPHVFLCVTGRPDAEESKSSWVETILRADALVSVGGNTDQESAVASFAMNSDGTCPRALTLFIESRL